MTFRVLRTGLLGFGLLLAALVPAFGQSTADIFTVARVPVDASAASAEEARLIAQDQGRSQAMRILLQRLTPSEDWAYLPSPSLRELLDMQVGFEVERERFSTQAGTQNRYIGQITYAFRPDLVRALLRSERLSFSETQAAPALVLPLLDRGAERLLWGEGNPWAAAWYEFDLSHELVPLVLPLGDLADSSAAPVTDVAQGNWEALRVLAERYRVDHVFVAHAVLEGNSLFVRMTEISANGIGRTVETQVANANDAEAPMGGLGMQAIRVLSGRLSERWKAQTMVSYDVQRRIEATAWFNSLSEWRQIRSALSTLPTVTEYNAHAMSASGAEVAVTFVGSPQQLAITLGQRGVVLRGESGRWALRSQAMAGPVTEYGPEPPVELVQEIRSSQPASPNAQTLTDDDLGDIFAEPLTDEEIEERRRQGLGERPGTMLPVGD